MITLKQPTCMKSSGFNKSLKILLTKAHVVNKRIWGLKTLFKKFIKSPSIIHKKVTPKLLNVINIDEKCFIHLSNRFGFELCESSSLVEVHLIELLPKNYENHHAFQIVVVFKETDQVFFYDVTPDQNLQNLCPNFPYSIQFSNKTVTLQAFCEPSDRKFQWLKSIVVPQFIKWGEEDLKIQESSRICTESLSLVSHEKYYEKYNKLKVKYGTEMVKKWPECTDPTKFVYEDVAIATYLLLLWEEERMQHHTKQLQSFVDLGCGNGLLVYILSMEGHRGTGVDVRKRQIWDIYPPNVKLEEKTIIPSDLNLFPDTDWIIGNHSDELTPWIPVVAARSSYKCNFFLLPCCAYNFDGSKYQRRNSSKSQYTEYLEHIMELCQNCGFITHTDRLKIPSTKRICLVGRGRTYIIGEHMKNIDKVQSLINTETVSEAHPPNDSWIKDFKARDSAERVRNCTQIDKTVIAFIVECIANYLLEGCTQDSKWSPGKTTEIHQLIELIPEDKLKLLKSECGGLQTLLRNNHNIFKVQHGKVQLRYPKTIHEVTNKHNKNHYQITVRKKACWFYDNHPQGCPLNSSECSYLHVNTQFTSK